ncbi:hypothetical protein M758_12G122300 [Ceratodon purpureus]|nr:hypothetical protein M758_12G122300 [Ceratodon purpureus]
MEVWDLAPGESISQDGSLRAFRYSEFTECPSAPFNTAEIEFLPSQVRCSDSLTTSLLLGSERCEYKKEEPSGGISSDLLCSLRDVDAPEEGNGSDFREDVQSGSSFSDSLGLSLADECRESKERESSPRRVFCDPRLLEEETQVAADNVVSFPSQQDSHLLFSNQHLHSAPQAFECDDVTEEIDFPSHRKDASEGILTTAAESPKSPLFETKQEDVCASTASDQKKFAAVLEDCDDIVQRWHNRKRVARAASNHQGSSLNAGIPKKLKQATEIKVESGTLHPNQPQDDQPQDDQPQDDQPVKIPMINDQKNCEQLPVTPPLSSDAKSTEKDIGAIAETDDVSESSFLRRKLNYSCSRDIKTFWQPETSPKQVEEGKWSCPRKYRPGGRQRTMDAWLK